MSQPTLIRIFGGLSCKIYILNKTGPKWSYPFWPLAHVGLVRVGPINPEWPDIFIYLFLSN